MTAHTSEQNHFKVFVTITYALPSTKDHASTPDPMGGVVAAEVPQPRRTVRRFSAEASTSFEAFKALLEESVLQRPMGATCVLSIAYKDSDGDTVEVTNEMEWREAILYQLSTRQHKAAPAPLSSLPPRSTPSEPIAFVAEFNNVLSDPSSDTQLMKTQQSSYYSSFCSAASCPAAAAVTENGNIVEDAAVLGDRSDAATAEAAVAVDIAPSEIAPTSATSSYSSFSHGAKSPTRTASSYEQYFEVSASPVCVGHAVIVPTVEESGEEYEHEQQHPAVAVACPVDKDNFSPIMSSCQSPLAPSSPLRDTNTTTEEKGFRADEEPKQEQVAVEEKQTEAEAEGEKATEVSEQECTIDPTLTCTESEEDCLVLDPVDLVGNFHHDDNNTTMDVAQKGEEEEHVPQTEVLSSMTERETAAVDEAGDPTASASVASIVSAANTPSMVPLEATEGHAPSSRTRLPSFDIMGRSTSSTAGAATSTHFPAATPSRANTTAAATLVGPFGWLSQAVRDLGVAAAAGVSNNSNPSANTNTSQRYFDARDTAMLGWWGRRCMNDRRGQRPPQQQQQQQEGQRRESVLRRYCSTTGRSLAEDSQRLAAVCPHVPMSAVEAALVAHRGQIYQAANSLLDANAAAQSAAPTTAVDEEVANDNTVDQGERVVPLGEGEEDSTNPNEPEEEVHTSAVLESDTTDANASSAVPQQEIPTEAASSAYLVDEQSTIAAAGPAPASSATAFQSVPASGAAEESSATLAPIAVPTMPLSFPSARGAGSIPSLATVATVGLTGMPAPSYAPSIPGGANNNRMMMSSSRGYSPSNYALPRLV